MALIDIINEIKSSEANKRLFLDTFTDVQNEIQELDRQQRLQEIQTGVANAGQQLNTQYTFSYDESQSLQDQRTNILADMKVYESIVAGNPTQYELQYCNQKMKYLDTQFKSVKKQLRGV